MKAWEQNLGQWDELRTLLAELGPLVETTGQVLVETFRSGGMVLACGNGGSASQASHLCAELVGRYQRERQPLRAASLTADGASLTCIVNDFEADDLFARQVRGLGRPGDCLVALSTSGASRNVARVLEAARDGGLQTIALLGRSGESRADRPVFEIADHEIVVPDSTTARIQEAHLLIIHTWCDLIDERFAKGE
jgi:D-sedoheptulose 7-phosphate isomerase